MSIVLRVGSLFTGIGGFDLGIEYAGLGRTVWMCEKNPYRRQVLEKNFPGIPIYDDVCEIDGGSAVAGRLKKLTASDVDRAVALYLSGDSLSKVALVFQISRQAMWDLLRRRIPMRSQQRHGSENHFYRGGSLEDERAHDLLEKAVIAGDLVRPDTCEACRQKPKPMKDGRSAIQGHHDNYNYPLVVRWLCQKCHHAWHSQNSAIPRKEVKEPDAVDIICGGFP